MTDYTASSRAYLARACALVAEGKPQSMFYAAFEVRCGIEARLKEYMISRKTPWQIAKLGREVEKVFDVYDKAVVITFVHPKTGEKFKAMYTPVTQKIRNLGERLGNYLHAVSQREIDKPDYFASLGRLLETAIDGLTFATTGKLLGPPLGGEPNKIKLHYEPGGLPDFVHEGETGTMIINVELLKKPSPDSPGYGFKFI